jgi:hypothetical protein
MNEDNPDEMALALLEERIVAMVRQVMALERALATMISMGGDTAPALEAIAAAYQALRVARRRRDILRERLDPSG